MKPKKSLGQNFLKCRWVAGTIIQTAGLAKNDTVLEIGPGTGALTRELSRSAGKVIAIEKDERLAEELKKSLELEGIKNVEIITGDVLKEISDIPKRYTLNTDHYKIAANIPYYLTSRLLRLLLEQKNKPAKIVLTVQKEVAVRITAKPPHLNLLALSVQTIGKPEVIKNIPAECFYPKPKVDSAIISISDISDTFFSQRGITRENFFGIAHLGFGQKRKKLLSVFSKKYGRQNSADAFIKSGIHENARPEELTPEQWGKLANIMQSAL